MEQVHERVDRPPEEADSSLLARYVDAADEEAFALLVRRHGPMVLAVCRRVLRNSDDADDAFQATFLVLARKAASIRPRERAGSFLYGVAYRCALDARQAIARRRVKESHAMPKASTEAASRDQDLRELLDRELSRLPEKYRLPVVLCDLEGQTRQQAARQLGWPEGTVAGRLARARALLAHRLTRRGVTVSAVSLALILTKHAATAQVPASLAGAAVKAAVLVASGEVALVGVLSAKAAALADGAMKALLLAKLKIATLAVVLVGVTAGGIVYATRPPAPRVGDVQLPLRPAHGSQD